MIESIRKFLTTPGGRVVGGIFSLALLGVCFFVIKSYLFGDSLGDQASYNTYIDTATGKPFKHHNEIGESPPILAPSGGHTGLKAEACYWKADGTAKTDPTWVLLNEQVGKKGPTFCPDCGRLVVGHNPQPGPGVKPPPTEAEYEAKNGH
jgi:hypothetical protein